MEGWNEDTANAARQIGQPMIKESRQIDPPNPSVPRSKLPPGPKELPVIGQALRLRRDIIGLLREAAAYGDISTVSLNPMTICLTNHPRLNREILVTHHRTVSRGQAAYQPYHWLMGNSVATSTGSAHLTQRRLMQPQFHRRHIEKFGQTMTEMTLRRAEVWTDGAALDIEQEMRELTLQIIVKLLFGVDQSDIVDRLSTALAQTNAYLFLRSVQPPTLRNYLHSLPLPSSQRFRRAKAFVDETVYRTIGERRESAENHADLLSLLLQARYEGDNGEDGGGMSDEQVRDELVTLYFAGHDTTATGLTWALYLVSENPEVEAQLHAELDEALDGRPATFTDLPNLPFTDQIVTESLRLYPPVWLIGRMVYQSVNIGGFLIPPGVNMIVCPIITHRDPRWFEQPDEFRPQRWTEEFRKQLPPFAYFPFGGGPTQCIGEGIAWMEMKIILANLCQRWRFRHDPDHRAEMLPQVTLLPKGGMPATVERRR